jgi:hypothetical protein
MQDRIMNTRLICLWRQRIGKLRVKMQTKTYLVTYVVYRTINKNEILISQETRGDLQHSIISRKVFDQFLERFWTGDHERRIY